MTQYAGRVVRTVTITMMLVILACCTHPTSDSSEAAPAWIGDDRTSLAVRILTYNVAGLPELFSASRPSVNHSLISPMLNDFDIVLVQEDFWYHRDLSSQVNLPFASSRSRKGLFGLGDGLNRFAAYGFDAYARTTWDKSHGVFRHSNDSLAPKGFTVATHRLSRVLEVDIYNLHMDAGGDHGDFLAREAQLDQLSQAIDVRSGQRAIVVAGDFNLKGTRPDDQTLLERFKESLSLLDAREVLAESDDRIDRILFRRGAGIEILPLSYSVESQFQDASGEPLSDHEAVAVEVLIRTSQ